MSRGFMSSSDSSPSSDFHLSKSIFSHEGFWGFDVYKNIILNFLNNTRMNNLCSKFNSPAASRSLSSPSEWKCQFFHRFYSSWCHQAWYRWANPMRTCSRWLPALLCHLLRNSDYFPRILSEIPRNRNFERICIWGDGRKKSLSLTFTSFRSTFNEIWSSVCAQ